MLNDEELKVKLETRPAERVTQKYIQSRLLAPEWIRPTGTVTICQLTVDNGYSVRGESACVNLENYDEEIGNRIAYDDAFRKLWPLFGFLLAEKNKNAAPTQAAA